MVKSQGNWAAVQAAPAGAVTVYRWTLSEVDQSSILDQAITDPQGAARRLVNIILAGLGGFRRPGLLVELLNEIGRGRAREYAALCRYAVVMLHDAGLLCAGPSWATGDYEQADWDLFVGTIQNGKLVGGCGFDAIALHAYWAQPGPSQWNGYRWRTYWKPGMPLVVVTECFRDRVRDGDIHVNQGYTPLGDGPFGWQASSQQPMDDDRAVAELEAYDASLRADPAILGAVAFTTSPNDDWKAKGFDMDSLASRLASITVKHTMKPYPSQPTTPEVPVANVDLSVEERVAHAVDENYAVGQTFGPSIGVVLHSTGGPSSSIENQYIGTINWFQNPDSGVSAHRVVGGGKFSEVCTSVHDHEVANHAGAENNAPSENRRRRGIEIAHGDGGAWDSVAYTPFQYAATAELIARWHLADKAKGWNWPIKIISREDAAKAVPGIVFHKDTPAGIYYGRRDPTPPFDGARLVKETLEWVKKITGGTAPPVTPPVIPPVVPGVPAGVTALRDRCYALAEEIQGTAEMWRAAGYPQHAQLIETTQEGFKTAIGPISKGER